MDAPRYLNLAPFSPDRHHTCWRFQCDGFRFLPEPELTDMKNFRFLKDSTALSTLCTMHAFGMAVGVPATAPTRYLGQSHEGAEPTSPQQRCCRWQAWRNGPWLCPQGLAAYLARLPGTQHIRKGLQRCAEDMAHWSHSGLSGRCHPVNAPARPQCRRGGICAAVYGLCCRSLPVL